MASSKLSCGILKSWQIKVGFFHWEIIEHHVIYEILYVSNN